jgi:mRNA interferase MazF
MTSLTKRSGTVITVAITSQLQKASFPLTLELKTVKIPGRSWVKISQIRTVAAERVGRKIGRVHPEEIDQVIEGFNEILGS